MRPSQTQIREKEVTCPRCSLYIRLPIFDNQHLGISEPITEETNLSKLIESQNREYDVIVDAIESNFKRANNLYRRCQKYEKILSEWAMAHADKQLLEVLEKVGKGKFDQDV